MVRKTWWILVRNPKTEAHEQYKKYFGENGLILGLGGRVGGVSVWREVSFKL